MMEINLLIKSSLILGMAWLVLLIFKKAAPGFRFNIWKWSFLLLLILPFFNIQPILTWTPTTSIVPPASMIPAADLAHQFQASSPIGQSQDTSSISTLNNYFQSFNWVRIIWLVGASFMLLLLLLEFFALGLLRKTKGNIPKRWQVLLAQSKQHYNIKKAVNLIFSEKAKTVFTYGYFRPIIVLPRLAETWSDKQIKAVLLHELAHIKRNDFIYNLVIQFVKAVYWFNPLVWKAAASIRLEAEQASDRLVLKSGMLPWDYGQRLIDAAKMLQARPPFSKQLSFSITGGQVLKKRMQSILNPEKKSFSLAKRLNILAGFGFLSFFLCSLTLVPINPRSLGHANPAVRIQAIQSLSRDFNPSVAQHLVPMLKDSHYLVREKTLIALAQFASSNTFYDIKACITDPNPQVRAATLYALSEIGCLPAYREIVEAQLDPDPLVRQKATDYLANYNRQKLMRWLKAGLHEDKNKPWISEQFKAIQKAGYQEGLLEIIAQKNRTKKQAIAEIINQIDQPGTFEELRKLLFRS